MRKKIRTKSLFESFLSWEIFEDLNIDPEPEKIRINKDIRQNKIWSPYLGALVLELKWLKEIVFLFVFKTKLKSARNKISM